MIKDRLTYGRNTPCQANKRERKRGRDLTWTLQGMPAPAWVMENWPGSATMLAVRCNGIREGKPVDETVKTSRFCVLEPMLWCSMCVIAGASRSRGIGLATPSY